MARCEKVMSLIMSLMMINDNDGDDDDELIRI